MFYKSLGGTFSEVFARPQDPVARIFVNERSACMNLYKSTNLHGEHLRVRARLFKSARSSDALACEWKASWRDLIRSIHSVCRNWGYCSHEYGEFMNTTVREGISVPNRTLSAQVASVGCQVRAVNSKIRDTMALWFLYSSSYCSRSILGISRTSHTVAWMKSITKKTNHNNNKPGSCIHHAL